MQRKLFWSFGLALLVSAAIGWAQEGHPLTGTWHGEWKQAGKATPVVILMRWDKQNLVGMINPGANSTPLKTLSLDPGWKVHLEADTKDNQKIVVDGTMKDIGSYNRTVTGTWAQGTAKGDFRMTRD